MRSMYPAAINKLPKASNNRSVPAEALIAFASGLILAPEGAVSKEVQYQLNSAGIRFVSIKQEYSVKGAIDFIRTAAVVVQSVPKK